MANKPYFGLRGARLNFAIFLVAGVDLLLFGYDQGVTGGLLTLPSFTQTFPEICTTGSCVANMSNAQITHQSLIQGVSVSSYNLGCFVGSLITLFIGDKLGRRKTILVGSITMAIGAILQCSSYALPQLIVGRIITGIGCGLNTSTVPVWQSECSKSHRRGQTVMAELAIVIFGVAMSYWIDFGFSYLDSSVAWRFPIAFQLVFALSVVATIMRMPESPRWLVLQDRDSEAVDVLAALYDLPAEDEYIVLQHHSIRLTVHASAKGGFKSIFAASKNKNFQRALLAYGIQVLQQTTGINLISELYSSPIPLIATYEKINPLKAYYAATIYETEIGLSGFMSRILAACNGTEYFLAMFPAIFLVERIGRRPLLLTGSIGMAISMIILAVMTSIGGTGPGIVAATFLFIFNTFFALGWCGLPWLIPTELVPLEIRAQANALATSANWIFNFMVVMITPVAFASIGWRTYIIFATFNAVTVPLIYFFYPETACRSLEEMDLIFAKSSGFLDTVSVASKEPNHFGRHGEILIDMVPEVSAHVANFSDAKEEAVQHDEEVHVG